MMINVTSIEHYQCSIMFEINLYTASKMYTFSSHLCYLLAGTNFGNHLKKTEKLVLIGAPHGLAHLTIIR